MARRAPDFRRPVRRGLSCWICAILGLFFVVGLILFVIQHSHHSEDRAGQSVLEINRRIDRTARSNYNFTEDMLSGRSYTRQLMEQMTLAKAYVIIAKEHNNLHLAWQLSSKIRICQSLLSKAAMNSEPISLEQAEPLIRSLSTLILKAQDAHYDIATTMMTMKHFIQSLQERANAATVQSAVFGEMATESIPKNLQCFELKIASEWIQNKSLAKLAEDRRNSPRLVDNNLYHFCLFSDNVLAVSVVVNSTVSNAEHPQQLVFHIVTNGVKYGVMQAWFLSNDFAGATVEVQNVEDLDVTKVDPEPELHNTNHISSLNRLRFYIPQIYPQLEKVIFLEDDVVIQKDMTPLFSLDLHGSVNGAVETCLESFHRYYKYLNFSNPLISSKFDPQHCGWAFGMNVFDLIAWKKANVTAKYEYWQEQQNIDKSIWITGSLPPGLLAFYGLTEPLDRRWHILGLGFDVNIDDRLIQTAAAIHFNGNMKPWLKMSIERYKILWEKYVNYTHPYLQYCANI